MDRLKQTIKRIRTFRDARGWMQFHNPKNLACSIAIEAAELLEHFQWKTEKESAEHAEKCQNELATEIADIAIYLLELADNLGIDLVDAIEKKLRTNERRYPVEKSKNKALKYTELK
jgi:dCTP diphosphatase